MSKHYLLLRLRFIEIVRSTGIVIVNIIVIGSQYFNKLQYTSNIYIFVTWISFKTINPLFQTITKERNVHGWTNLDSSYGLLERNLWGKTTQIDLLVCCPLDQALSLSQSKHYINFGLSDSISSNMQLSF